MHSIPLWSMHDFILLIQIYFSHSTSFKGIQDYTLTILHFYYLFTSDEIKLRLTEADINLLLVSFSFKGNWCIQIKHELHGSLSELSLLLALELFFVRGVLCCSHFMYTLYFVLIAIIVPFVTTFVK